MPIVFCFQPKCQKQINLIDSHNISSNDILEPSLKHVRFGPSLYNFTILSTPTTNRNRKANWSPSSLHVSVTTMTELQFETEDRNIENFQQKRGEIQVS